jgi:hypothetical protein
MRTSFKALDALVLSTAVALSTSAGAITVDGTTSGDAYGAARAVQAVQTQFGDNLSELNAAYGVFDTGQLFLALTGNLENNFNNIEILIDSQPGGFNVFPATPGNNGSANMAGLTFDAAFAPDYHIMVRRGTSIGSTFDLDIGVLGTATFSSHLDVFGGSATGVGTTGTGPGNASPIALAYDDSNVAGVTGGTGAANAAAALAVQTGLELGIALSDLGSPAGAIKVLAFINNSNHDFASNQFLGALAPPQGNLGGDGGGNFTGIVNFDLNGFAGDQYFLVPEPELGSLLTLGLAALAGWARIRHRPRSAR